MEKREIIICILLAIITTNLIRVLPIIAAWRGAGLFPVAIICCTIAYLMDGIMVLW